MGWINHPLLVGQGEVTPAQPTQPQSWSLCALDSVIPITAEIDTTTLTGIQDGDYLIIVVHNSKNSSSITIPFYATPDDGRWTILCQSHNLGHIVYGRWYSSSDTTYTFTLDYFGSSGNTICWYVYAVRNGSRRVPVDFLLTPGFMGLHADQDRVWAPESRQHGTNGLWFFINFAAAASQPIYDYDSADLISNGATVLSVDNNGPNSDRIVDVVTLRRQTRTRENLLTSQLYSGMSGTMSGWTFVNTELVTSTASSIIDYDTIGLIRDGTDKTYYIYRSVDLVAGQTYYWRGLCGGRVSSATDYYPAMVIANPSGGLEVGTRVVVTSGSQGDSYGIFTLPDWLTCWGVGYSGLPDLPIADQMMEYTAAETGTYQLRVYILKQGVATLNFNAGSTSATPINSYIGLFGSSFSQEVLAPRCGTALDSNYATTVADELLWRATTIGSCTNHRGLVFQCPAADDVITTPQLTSANYDGNPRYLLSDDNLSIRSGVDNPYGYSGGSVPFNTTHYRPDRIVMPYYYATEDAASLTQGKYYWEVTIAGNNSGTYMAIGAKNMARSPYPYISNYSNNVTQYLLFASGATVDGDGTGSSWGSTFADGDVLGFALDIVGDTLAAYKNGSLVYTFTLSTDITSEEATKSVYAPVLVFNSNVAQNTKATFNFTGPFVYAKPSGYTAYDWINEVA